VQNGRLINIVNYERYALIGEKIGDRRIKRPIPYTYADDT
jgi:hypothetical protein